MKQRDNYMICCDCGYAKHMFKKVYKNTAIYLCRKCALNYSKEWLEGDSLMEGVEVLNTFVKGDCGFDVVGIVAII